MPIWGSKMNRIDPLADRPPQIDIWAERRSVIRIEVGFVRFWSRSCFVRASSLAVSTTKGKEYA